MSGFLRQHKDAILRSWETRVTSEQREIELAGLALRDDVPKLLDELAAWLASDAAPETSLVAARALTHVMQRLDEGLSLAQVFREYRLLRESIIEEVLGAEAAEQERAGASGGGEGSRIARIGELARLNAGLDVVLSQSVVQFVEERDRRAGVQCASAAQVLRESETRYRSLFESIDEGFCIINVIFEGERPVDYRFLQVNPAFERHTGLKNAAGKRIREMVPDHDQHWFEAYGRVAETGEPARFENAARALGRFYDVYAFRAGPPEQRLVAVLFNDVTERKRAEEALRVREERQAFLLRLSDAVRTMASAAEIQGVAARLLGEHLGANQVHCGETAGDVVATCRARKTAVCCNVDTDPTITKDEAAVITGAGFKACIAVPLIKDGKWIATLAAHSIEPREWTPEEVALVEETAERTWAAVERARAEQALRESEARLRRLWESGMVGVLFFDLAAGRITDANEEFLEMVGYKRDDLEPGGISWTQMTPDEYRALDDHATDELHATGVNTPYEKEFVRKDGSRVPTYIGAATFDAERDRGISFVLDISKAKELERALRQANQQLVESNERKNHFLAVLSHELRNPLAPIKNSLYVLDRAVPGGDQARRAKDVIERQIDQLSHLVDDLLDVTRITRGKIQLQRRGLELNELVRRTIDDHRVLFEAADVRLEVEAAAHPVFIDADWNRTAQVVSNLLQNSAKFTPRGGRVLVTVERDADARQAVIRVADTGLGMKPGLLSRLFQPFMQADETLDRSRGGLGLGLALVKGIVEQHGGSIEARSQGLERGSEFIVRLPLALSAPATVKQAAAPAVSPRHRVLIIEDNVDAAQSLLELLELLGHEVAVAHDGQEGIAKAREFRPGLVLCDIGLPGIDGYEVARAFRADDALRGVHLVALSGYALPEDLQKAAEAGFERHLAKPPSLEKLKGVLGQVSPR